MDLGLRVERVILGGGGIAAILRDYDEALAAFTALGPPAALTPYQKKLAALRAELERAQITKTRRDGFSDDLDALGADLADELTRMRPEYGWYFNVGIGCGAIANAAAADAGLGDVIVSTQLGQKKTGRQLNDDHLTATLGMMKQFVDEAPAGIPDDLKKPLRELASWAKRAGTAYNVRERETIARRAEQIALLATRSTPPVAVRPNRLADLERLAMLAASPATRAELTRLQAQLYGAPPPTEANASRSRVAGIPVDRALEAMKANKWDDVRSEAFIAIRAEPDDPDLYTLVGLSYAEQKDYERAYVFLNEALWRDPADADAKRLMDAIGRKPLVMPSATAPAPAAAPPPPPTAAARAATAKERGKAEFARKDHSAARQAFAEAVALDAGDVESHNLLGLATMYWCDAVAATNSTGQPLACRQQTIDILRGTLKLAPTSYSSHYNLGVAFSRADRDAEAVQAFSESLRLNPSHLDSYQARIASYLDLRQYENALKDADAVLRLDSTSLYALEVRGLASYELGRHQDAIAAFKQVVAIDAKRPGPLQYLGAAYLGIGDRASAAGTLATLQQQFPGSTQARALNDAINGFGGVGFTISNATPGLIESIIPNSPAARAGLQPGDQIAKIDGVAVAGLTTNQIVDKIRGTAGTPVTLTIRIPGTARERDITLVRAAIVAPVPPVKREP